MWPCAPRNGSLKTQFVAEGCMSCHVYMSEHVMGLFWLLLVGCFEPVLAHLGPVLAHLGPVFALLGPVVGCLDSSWACLRQRWQPGWSVLGGGPRHFKSFFGGQKMGPKIVFLLMPFRGLILVLVLSSLRNHFYGFRLLSWGVIFCHFSYVLTPNIL